jgi:Domain of unknown function (DUF4157)
MADVGRWLSQTEVEAYDHVPRAVAVRARLHRVRALPPGSSGMTFGHQVLLRRGHEGNRKLVAHELVHVAQYADRGRVRFLIRYLADYARNLLRLRSHRQAYLAIPAEVDARAAAADWLRSHPEPLDGA